MNMRMGSRKISRFGLGLAVAALGVLGSATVWAQAPAAVPGDGPVGVPAGGPPGVPGGQWTTSISSTA